MLERRWRAALDKLLKAREPPVPYLHVSPSTSGLLAELMRVRRRAVSNERSRPSLKVAGVLMSPPHDPRTGLNGP